MKYERRELLKRVEVKIVGPEGQKFQPMVFRPPHGKGYTQEGVDQILHNVASRLENELPQLDFRLVPRGQGLFTMVGSAKPEEPNGASDQGKGGADRGDGSIATA